ncbi:MAG: hypothetical protein OHK0039_11510 [Bacteroidia bacterium]
MGTQVVKVFDLVIGRTGGLRDDEAVAYDPLTIAYETWDHKAYYPGATAMHIHLTADRRTGQLLGVQIMGHTSAEISKRLDVLTVALHQRLTTAQLSELDLSYTPPLSSPWDPVQMTAQAWEQLCGV